MHYSEIKCFVDDRVLITLKNNNKILSVIEEVTPSVMAIKKNGYTAVLENDFIKSIQSKNIKFLFPYQVVFGPNLARSNKRITQTDITNIMELLKKIKKYELITRSKCFVKEVRVDKMKLKGKLDVDVKKKKNKEKLEIETFEFLSIEQELKICPFALIKMPRITALFAVDYDGNPRLLDKYGCEILQGKRLKNVIKYIRKVKRANPKVCDIVYKSKKERNESASSLARIFKD